MKKSRDLDTKFLEEWEEFTESVVYGSNERERWNSTQRMSILFHFIVVSMFAAFNKKYPNFWS